MDVPPQSTRLISFDEWRLTRPKTCLKHTCHPCNLRTPRFRKHRCMAMACSDSRYRIKNTRTLIDSHGEHLPPCTPGCWP